MREEPKHGQDEADWSSVRFRPRRSSKRSPASAEPTALTWQIATGVFLGIIAALFAWKLWERHEAAEALKAFEVETKRIEAEADRELSRLARQMQSDNVRYTPRGPAPLRAGERCINGRRFQRVQNGWVQVNERC